MRTVRIDNEDTHAQTRTHTYTHRRQSTDRQSGRRTTGSQCCGGHLGPYLPDLVHLDQLHFATDLVLERQQPTPDGLLQRVAQTCFGWLHAMKQEDVLYCSAANLVRTAPATATSRCSRFTAASTAASTYTSSPGVLCQSPAPNAGAHRATAALWHTAETGKSQDPQGGV